MSIAYPVEIAGTNLGGSRFSERTTTMVVSRYGCCLSLTRLLMPGQRILMRRIGTDDETPARIVARMNAASPGHTYGIESRNSCEGLWGIRFSSSFYERLLDTMQDGVYFVNRDRKITYWNSAAERLAGYSPAEAVGKRCCESFLAHVDETGKSLCADGCPLSQAMLSGESRQLEIYLRHKEGHRVPVSVRVLPMRDTAGNIAGAVEFLQDASARKKVEHRVSELENLAFRDPLTALPNRRYLQMKVEQALEECRRFHRRFGLLMFDVDRFKQVNDTHGHNVGDAVLKAVAATLAQNQRAEDIVGRWGGEEFLVLTCDVDAIALSDLAERCRVLVVESSVPLDSSRVSVTVSIGATPLDHFDTCESALQRVDQLMYQSKRSGGDQTTVG
ncbi:MAG TPA: diguanylate cyclase [Candidatus Sulfotelmatobacter sp.]|nr:diguanylate cyclase [Candidatus Sulfotelmatobacter sp.]